MSIKRIVRATFSPAEWRWRRRRFVGFFVRGWRGYADHDVWGADHYLAGVMAGMLRHLAVIHHGVPGDFLCGSSDPDMTTIADIEAGSQAWQAWLLDKAEWLEWYWRDDDGIVGDTNWIDPHLSREVVSARIAAHEEKMRQFHEVVMPDLGKHWGSLWD